jgi:hypothetical protein
VGAKPRTPVRKPSGSVPRVGDFEYVLKQVASDMTAHGGFRWPESGPVECPDWDPAPRCGGGLHGWLRGEGDGGLASSDPDARWLILRVPKEPIVDLGGKVKFPRAEVIACGPRHEIVAEMRSLCPDASVIYATIAKSDQQAASAGSYGQASAGSYGQASAGDRGQASAGDGGQASAGYRGQASAGEKGCVIVRWWDSDTERYRVAVGYIGETLDVEGKPLEVGVKYRLDSKARFERVS